MIGYDQIRIDSPYPIQVLKDVQIEWKPGEHGRITLTAICKESSHATAALDATSEDQLHVYAQKEQEKISLFKGVVHTVEVENRNGVYTLTLEGISGSFELDIVKRKRSFPEEKQTYKQLVNKLAQGYARSDVLYQTGEQSVGEAILQYDETDWELMKRMASRLHTVVVSDIWESAAPKLYFGMPTGTQRTIRENTPYTASKDLKGYQQAGGTSAGLHDTDFFKYEIESGERYALGDEVQFRQKTMIVTELRSRMEKGHLLFSYVLARAEGIRSDFIPNFKTIGISLEGEVLAVRGEEVKLRLAIDKDDGVSEPHWYPFAPPTGSAMYSMPKVGTHASLYFPDASGSRAMILGAVRTNGDGCAKTSDPNDRYFGTEHGSELKMAPGRIHIMGDPGGTLQMSLDDATGIEITSPKKLTLEAEQEIILNTPKKIIIDGTSQVMAYQTGGSTGLSVENEYHVLGGNVWADGSDRTAYPPFDDEPKEGEPPPPPPPPEPFNWGKLGMNILGGLAVVAAVAVVAAITVATLGAGTVVIAAVAGGALLAGGLGVASLAASDVARGEVSDFSDYALTGLKEAGIGAVSGAIFGPLGVGGTLLRKAAIGGVTNAAENLASQVLSGEKINWGSVAKDAGLGFVTVGVLDSKVGKAIGGFAEKVGSKVTPQWIGKGVDAVGAGFGKAVNKLEQTGSKLGQKFNEQLSKMADGLNTGKLATANGAPVPHVNKMDSGPLPQTDVQKNYNKVMKEMEEGAAKKIEGTGKGPNVPDELRPIDPETGKIIYHDWVSAKPVDLETDKYLIDKVAEARSGLSNKYKDKGNFAYVKADIDGLDQSEFFAHSKISDPNKKIPGAENFSLDPENPSFPATKAALNEGKGEVILRDMDTEYKILNDIDKKLNHNREAKGTIVLFTEKDTCGSCNLVIRKFKEHYPNITIEIIHNNGKLIEP
ncbi:MAG: deaminase domain-containing protein [Bacillota bacterium]